MKLIWQPPDTKSYSKKFDRQSLSTEQVMVKAKQYLDIYLKLTSVFPRGNFPAAWISTTLCLQTQQKILDRHNLITKRPNRKGWRKEDAVLYKVRRDT